MRRFRLFLDANVFVAAAGRPEGGSATVLAAGGAGLCTLLTSRWALAEAERNIREKLGLNRQGGGTHGPLPPPATSS